MWQERDRYSYKFVEKNGLYTCLIKRRLEFQYNSIKFKNQLSKIFGSNCILNWTDNKWYNRTYIGISDNKQSAFSKAYKEYYNANMQELNDFQTRLINSIYAVKNQMLRERKQYEKVTNYDIHKDKCIDQV